MTIGAFARTLRVLRAERGYSLTEASKKIGIERHTLRQLELGQREPYYGTLRKIAAGYDVEINDLVGTSAEKAQAPLVEAGTDLHMPVVGGVVLEDLRTKAEAFVERWGETASTIKSIQIEDEGIDALLRTVEWAVRAEASTLFREFLAVPQFALRFSKVYDRVQLSEIIGEVDRVANDLLMTFISMDARSVSPLQEQEKREYSLLLAYARESARMLGDPSSGTGLGEGGMEGINRIPE